MNEIAEAGEIVGIAGCDGSDRVDRALGYFPVRSEYPPIHQVRRFNVGDPKRTRVRFVQPHWRRALLPLS